MAWTTPRTWVAGETVTAALMNTHVRDNLKAIGDPWLTYTPVVTAPTTSPTLGTGGANGRYIAVGKLIIFNLTVTFGTGATAGTGNYATTLPVTARAAGDLLNGSCRLVGASSNVDRFHPILLSTTQVSAEWQGAYPTGAQQLLSNANPWAWTAGMNYQISGLYEAA